MKPYRDILEPYRDILEPYRDILGPYGPGPKGTKWAIWDQMAWPKWEQMVNLGPNGAAQNGPNRNIRNRGTTDTK